MSLATLNTQAAIEPWLLAIISRQAAVEPSEITPASRIAEDLRLDSLDEVEIAIAIEAEKAIDIDVDTWLQPGATVADVAAAVARLVTEQVAS